MTAGMNVRLIFRTAHPGNAFGVEYEVTDEEQSLRQQGIARMNSQPGSRRLGATASLPASFHTRAAATRRQRCRRSRRTSCVARLSTHISCSFEAPVAFALPVTSVSKRSTLFNL
jgi:hypothetical protein